MLVVEPYGYVLAANDYPLAIQDQVKTQTII